MTTPDNSADVLAPSQAAREAAEFDADQQRRRAELVKRISVFCDHINLPGEDGDAAYDLLREAAARIGSDRLRFERDIRTESADDATRCSPCPRRADPRALKGQKP